MRNDKYLSFKDLSDVVITELQQAVKHIKVVSHRLNGADTRKQVTVKTPSRDLGSMPFIQVAFSDYKDGWDDSQSNQLPHGDSTYTDLGGTKSKKEPVERKERVLWEISIYGQKYEDVLEIFDAIHRYFDPHGTLVTSDDYLLDYVLDSGGFGIILENKQGSIESFVGTFNLMICNTTTNLNTETERVLLTAEVEMDVSTELNTTDTETVSTETKALTS